MDLCRAVGVSNYCPKALVSGAPKRMTLELFWESLCQVCNSLVVLRN